MFLMWDDSRPKSDEKAERLRDLEDRMDAYLVQ